MTIIRFFILNITTGLIVAQHAVHLKGIVCAASDSSEVVPFAYVFSKSTGHGVMTSLNGFFSLSVPATDTIIFHHTQFYALSVPVSELLRDSAGLSRIFLKRKIFQLPEVKVMDYTLKPYEKETMDKIIRESKFSFTQSINSPITALYYAWSRRGREIRKLAKLYEEILLEERIRQKLNPATLRQLTGDQNIDYESFRKFCFELKNEDFLFLDNYSLYQKVMDCYRRFKKEK